MQPEHKGALRVLAVLDTLSELGRPVALSELAQQLAIPKSTLHRVLLILKTAQYVRQDRATDRYELGPHALRLGVLALRGSTLLQAAPARMDQLMRRTEETVQLSILDTERVLVLHRVESDVHGLRAATPKGARTPLYATAAGKALLAGLTAADLESLLQRLPLQPLTPRTITDRATLEGEITLVRERGYSTDRGENIPDVHCVAVPIRDLGGRVVAALSITAPAARLPLEQAAAFAGLARATAAEIELDLGVGPIVRGKG